MCMRMVWRRGLVSFFSPAARAIACCIVGASGQAALLLTLPQHLNAAEPQRDADVVRFDMDAELELAEGRRLFEHEWKVKDERSRSGDGLGPVFNDRSCKACHHQGGTGGGGGREHNVQVIATTGAGAGNQTGVNDRNRVQRVHPGLVENSSVVLHSSGTTHGYDAWRARRVRDAVIVDHTRFDAQHAFEPSRAQLNDMRAVEQLVRANSFLDNERSHRSQNMMIPESHGGGWGGGKLARAKPSGPRTTIEQRNSTALFGAGVIDEIPESVLDDMAAWQRTHMPKVAGRAVRTGDGKIGRFGWKSQQSNLTDFTLTACAVEVGLDVPGHAQGIGPDRQKYQSPGHDLDAVDCRALVTFISSLPAPAPPRMRGADDPLRQGHTLFVRVGCADCHVEDLGEAKGIYSDLLVHDLGEGLWGDSYAAFVSQPSKSAPQARDAASKVHIGEWRTPPLWGCADSAPYLHDGRAATLQDAIFAHGGQAARSKADFAALTEPAQEKIISFLESLKAPGDPRIANARRTNR